MQVAPQPGSTRSAHLVASMRGTRSHQPRASTYKPAPFEPSPLASVARPVEQLGECKDDEQSPTSDQHGLFRDTRGEQPAADHSDASAEPMPRDAPQRDAPQILVGSHRDRRDLRPTPLGHKGEAEGLQEHAARPAAASCGLLIARMRRAYGGYARHIISRSKRLPTPGNG
eukprot:CAMPEP_0181217282 /NCGR_PEP_ID=MMETSP1096-20121128/27064_1 /TAXON_ID=156174 ORGANISM="Chrysochromulina ericina, Strain CCMP281" /NCGR_SAMPLE_ID=MMETSP1096 /ASSEMBLY_ACC=CAM_ASM_000453 /LENGTH=170 /DNA_ID=CAMNT_0023309395 /DNA_START=367 /DNA_END=875 /DNA_ORIENTATION=+